MPPAVLFLKQAGLDKRQVYQSLTEELKWKKNLLYKFIVNKYKVSVSQANKQVILQFWDYIPDLGV